MALPVTLHSYCRYEVTLKSLHCQEMRRFFLMVTRPRILRIYETNWRPVSHLSLTTTLVEKMGCGVIFFHFMERETTDR